MRSFTVVRIVAGEIRHLPIVALNGAQASRLADARKHQMENDEGRRSDTPAHAIAFRVPAASADEKSPRAA